MENVEEDNVEIRGKKAKIKKEEESIIGLEMQVDERREKKYQKTLKSGRKNISGLRKRETQNHNKQQNTRQEKELGKRRKITKRSGRNENQKGN